MEKIVNKALKVDLHIHSSKSKFKDGRVVLNNTIENIDVLIKKLNYYKVNICSISDHDSFDYKLYEKLKQEEKKGSIEKVFPAVEFSVIFTDKQESPVHIIAIFSDADDKKIKNIEKILEFNKSTNKPNYDLDEAFSENKFIEILSKINLDAILIAHQKQTLTSTSQPQENDANIVGEVKFNEFLISEYFEAFEFKNRKNQVFNNISKSQYSEDILRFITGSDCHEWTAYPKYSSKSNEDEYKHTYLKCLPNFKGLALALTDDTRISMEDNFFSHSKDVFDTISITISDKKYSIPMSKGINVIIGDNSIGKSLLLHKITNYYRDDSLSPLNQNVIIGYERYLKQNKLEIHSKISKDQIFLFDTQGEIRKKFDQGMLKKNDFFADKYPSDIDVMPFKTKLEKEVDEVCESLKSKFDYNEQYKKIFDLKLLKNKEEPSNLSLLECSNEKEKNNLKSLSKIITQISKVSQELENLLKLIKNKEEIEKIKSFKLYLEYIKLKYQKQKDLLVVQINIINCINTVFNEFLSKESIIKSTSNQKLSEYLANKEIFVNSLILLLEKRKNMVNIKFDIKEEKIDEGTLDYLNFVFIKRTNINSINNDYFSNLLNFPLKKKPKITYEMIDSEEMLINALKDYDETYSIDFYKKKLFDKISSDLSQKSVVNKLNEKGEYVVYSSGLNSQIYFEILSADRYKNGIYIIDQPEDDVSPKSIKKHLLKNFKDMGRNRQIIMVTHNPQFVVNLDVDNVIIFTKDVDNLKIESGALEYQDSETNILKLVATLLDGGVETIRRRWKRYEKQDKD